MFDIHDQPTARDGRREDAQRRLEALGKRTLHQIESAGPRPAIGKVTRSEIEHGAQHTEIQQPTLLALQALRAMASALQEVHSAALTGGTADSLEFRDRIGAVQQSLSRATQLLRSGALRDHAIASQTAAVLHQLTTQIDLLPSDNSQHDKPATGHATPPQPATTLQLGLSGTEEESAAKLAGDGASRDKYVGGHFKQALADAPRTRYRTAPVQGPDGTATETITSTSLNGATLEQLFAVYVWVTPSDPAEQRSLGTVTVSYRWSRSRVGTVLLRGAIRSRLQAAPVAEAVDQPSLGALQGDLQRVAEVHAMIDAPSPALLDHSIAPGASFRPRRRPDGARMPHNAMDVPVPAGTGVYAPIDGEVIFSGGSPGYGNLVRLFHRTPPRTSLVMSGTLETAYAHLSERLVAVGDRIRAGQAIGLSGQARGDERGDASTVAGIPAHLHMSVLHSGNQPSDGYSTTYENGDIGEDQPRAIHPHNWLAEIGVSVSTQPIFAMSAPEASQAQRDATANGGVTEPRHQRRRSGRSSMSGPSDAEEATSPRPKQLGQDSKQAIPERASVEPAPASGRVHQAPVESSPPASPAQHEAAPAPAVLRATPTVPRASAHAMLGTAPAEVQAATLHSPAAAQAGRTREQRYIPYEFIPPEINNADGDVARIANCSWHDLVRVYAMRSPNATQDPGAQPGTTAESANVYITIRGHRFSFQWVTSPGGTASLRHEIRQRRQPMSSTEVARVRTEIGGIDGSSTRIAEVITIFDEPPDSAATVLDTAAIAAAIECNNNAQLRIDWVRRMQRVLRMDGQMTSSNGDFDEETVLAIAQFQRDAGLDGTGVITGPTRQAIEQGFTALAATLIGSHLSERELIPERATVAERYGYYRSIIERACGVFDVTPGHVNLLGIRGVIVSGSDQAIGIRQSASAGDFAAARRDEIAASAQTPSSTDRPNSRSLALSDHFSGNHAGTADGLSNDFDDVIVSLWIDTGGQQHVRERRGSVDPNSLWSNSDETQARPEAQRQGTSHLRDGQYLYNLDRHRTSASAHRLAISHTRSPEHNPLNVADVSDTRISYDALVATRNIEVWRDAYRADDHYPSIAEEAISNSAVRNCTPSYVDQGIAINIHSAPDDTVSSFGCQNIPLGAGYIDFIDEIRPQYDAAAERRHSATPEQRRAAPEQPQRTYYTLIDASRIERGLVVEQHREIASPDAAATAPTPAPVNPQ